MPGNHRETEHSEVKTQSEINRDVWAAIKKLQDQAQENAEWIHGNGQPELIENSIHQRLNAQDKDCRDRDAALDVRQTRIEWLVKKGFWGICTMAAAGLMAGVKLLAGAIMSILHSKP